MFEEKLLEPHFTSVLAPYMLDVVEQKRALGNKYNAGVEALSAFDDFCNEQQLRIPAISKELLQKWEKKRPHENETTQCFRISYAETINCFSTAMSNASEICMNVRRARCRQVGAYLHWLYDHKYTDLDYSLQLPNFKRTAPQIPQVWSPEEIDKILAVIDTANPVGRRNYAIFLLLARTGLRISDVLGLKFSNINWKENCISLSQQKTGNALSLPLSKELGMAIISYLQDGRPQSSSAFIFLSHNAPFQPLGEHNNFNPEFHKYLRRAGIAIPTKRHTGVHTIRHSFATNMLRKGTPVQDVSQILGHSNISVTETYLRVDIEHGKYDLLVLDVSLPDGTGFEFCKKVRQVSKVPIIFLTAADEEMNIIMGLDIGGDDYITKPFKLGVLVSRVNALLRRAKDFSSADTQLESNGMKVLLLQGQAFKNGKPLDLTAAEYKLLCLFMKNPNMVLTKEQILDKLWDCDGNYIDSSTLTVYIRRLRIKIEDNPSEPQMLLTVRGMGYKWNVIR